MPPNNRDAGYLWDMLQAARRLSAYLLQAALKQLLTFKKSTLTLTYGTFSSTRGLEAQSKPHRFWLLFYHAGFWLSRKIFKMSSAAYGKCLAVTNIECTIEPTTK
jgi:hypothetical protein